MLFGNKEREKFEVEKLATIGKLLLLELDRNRQFRKKFYDLPFARTIVEISMTEYSGKLTWI